tara:strand:+ start:295 stop:879 length:585 start_codon:yes stop_codon:yes gene_type:complete
MHVLCDQSGSMANMGTAPYDGCRELVESLTEGASITISTFNSNVNIGTRQTREQVLQSPMTELKRASGSTSLYDAIVAGVEHSMARPASSLVFVVVTDGHDTSSRASLHDARNALQRLQSRSTHKAIFLGSNQDAVVAAESLGIPPHRALTFGNEQPELLRQAFRCVSETTSLQNEDGDLGFTPIQREASIRLA